MPKGKLKPRKQVAALPVSVDGDGKISILLITSRETRRLIIPKGWPMKGQKDYRAAEIEAEQEAGVVGRIRHKPIGSYTYWKRRETAFELCTVDVFVLQARKQLDDWREKGQRQQAWLLLEDAIECVEEPGLVPLLQELPNLLAGKQPRRKPPLLSTTAVSV